MDARSLMKVVWLGARPKTLAAGFVPVWAGGVLAWKLTGRFDWWLWVCTLLGALCIQVATNFFNDAVDGRNGADGERRTGPRRLTGSGDMGFAAVMTLGAVFLLGAAFFGSFLDGTISRMHHGDGRVRKNGQFASIIAVVESEHP